MLQHSGEPGRPEGRCEQTAQAMLAAALMRDHDAHARDVAAVLRDIAAEARDGAMARLDSAFDHEAVGRRVTGAEVVMRAADQRRRAARYRTEAAQHRALAASDRVAASDDREQACNDRLRAFADRESLALRLALAEREQPTGEGARATGLRDLERELDRCRRTDAGLVVACVGVVTPRSNGDRTSREPAAALPALVVQVLTRHLRSYDLVIWLGADEVLCAMPGMAQEIARLRMRDIASALASASRDAAAIRTGFAELEPDDSPARLIERADRDLVGGPSV